MDNVVQQGGGLLPGAILWPATGLFAILLVFLLSRTSSSAARFSIFAIWLRLVLAAHHNITFQMSPAGISWQALASAGMVGWGLWIVSWERLLASHNVPIFILVGVIVVSGLANGVPGPTITTIIKYGYLLIIAASIAQAASEVGSERLIGLTLCVFLVPLSLQLASLIAGVAKASEEGAATSYIGGYHHESAFSVSLVAGLLLVCLLRRLSIATRVVFLLYAIFAVFLANYRTSVLAMIPLIAAVLMTVIPARFVPRQRAYVSAVILLLMMLGAGFIAGAGSDRFADLSVALQSEDLIKPPEEFTRDERRLLSARPYIWSKYYYGWSEGNQIQHAIGFGPDSWIDRFRVYAHNQFLSALFEYGLSGLAATLLLLSSQLVLALRVKGPDRLLLSAAHSGFALLCMATMPLWQIEGLIFYGILIGLTVHRLRPGTRSLIKRAATSRNYVNVARSSLASSAPEKR